MTRYHSRPEGDIPFTQDEEDAANAEEAILIAKQPMQEWEAEMKAHDAGGMSRTEENIIDSMDVAQLARLDQYSKDKHAAKKESRGRKP